MEWLNVIIAVLTLGAVARITRLITDDSITAPLRSAIDRRATAHPTPDGRLIPAPRFWREFSTWAHCPWCVSMWVAAAAAAAHWLWADTTFFRYAVAALTASHLVALAADWLDSPPPTRAVSVEGPLDIRLTHTPPHPPAS